jgi:hypothetical protein
MVVIGSRGGRRALLLISNYFNELLDSAAAPWVAYVHAGSVWSYTLTRFQSIQHPPAATAASSNDRARQ